jgi:PAS domain S-box-containing protein
MVRFTVVGIVITLFNGWMRAARRQLLQQRDTLRTALTSIGDGVVTTDVEGRITMMNGVAEGLTGWNAADAIGQLIERVLEVRRIGSRDAVANPVREALARGRGDGPRR